MQFHGWRMLLGGPKPPAPMDQSVIATAPRQNAYFVGSRPALFSSCGRTHPQHPQRHWRTDGVGANYVPRLTSRPMTGGSAMDGSMLRRTITMGAPQQVHSSWGRGAGAVAGVGGLKGCLNTSNFSSAIRRVLLGCKKPKLRARRNPLGNTCCNTSRTKAAPRLHFRGKKTHPTG